MPPGPTWLMSWSFSHQYHKQKATNFNVRILTLTLTYFLFPIICPYSYLIFPLGDTRQHTPTPTREKEREPVTAFLFLILHTCYSFVPSYCIPSMWQRTWFSQLEVGFTKQSLTGQENWSDLRKANQKLYLLPHFLFHVRFYFMTMLAIFQ